MSVHPSFCDFIGLHVQASDNSLEEYHSLVLAQKPPTNMKIYQCECELQRTCKERDRQGLTAEISICDFNTSCATLK